MKLPLDKNILLGDAINPQEKVTVPGVPGLDQIIFTEWSRIGNDFKRREFRFDTMYLDGANAADGTFETEDDDLFAESKPATHHILTTDSGKEIMKPVPVAEFPLTHYTKIAEKGKL